jgi:hypothetical protein
MNNDRDTKDIRSTTHSESNITPFTKQYINSMIIEIIESLKKTNELFYEISDILEGRT